MIFIFKIRNIFFGHSFGKIDCTKSMLAEENTFCIFMSFHFGISRCTIKRTDDIGIAQIEKIIDRFEGRNGEVFHHKAAEMEVICFDRRIVIDTAMHKMAGEKQSLARFQTIFIDPELHLICASIDAGQNSQRFDQLMIVKKAISNPSAFGIAQKIIDPVGAEEIASQNLRDDSLPR